MVHLKLLAAIGYGLLAPVLAQGSLRYMPFGDSITELGCWRAEVWQKLQEAGGPAIDFVGSMNSQTQCSGLNYDRNHEGHAGFQAVNIANQNQLVNWLQSNPADIITMHLGTNDVLNGRSTNDIIASFDKMVDQMRASNPRMRIIVAQIIPLPFTDQLVRDLNVAIPAWAQSKNIAESPIWVIDQYEGFSSSDLGGDGIHPNAAGDTKIANKFFPAIVKAAQSLQAENYANERKAVGFSALSDIH
ncbi:hypothetical protein AJ80_01283 [Polytolypa hystricis UAMH7299]|uniref:SGNH hydrolase-type esterase domain-containing protein n=1 Tax=Polytolypa hystricis (strain UAMH7299) TaxID=1447883 RepID=A0A2B7YZH9_POLH7|nr:hypothetical protein AJ80_01283 [Polytolypa hystricis UAMH7299]